MPPRAWSTGLSLRDLRQDGGCNTGRDSDRSLRDYAFIAASTPSLIIKEKAMGSKLGLGISVPFL